MCPKVVNTFDTIFQASPDQLIFDFIHTEPGPVRTLDLVYIAVLLHE